MMIHPSESAITDTAGFTSIRAADLDYRLTVLADGCLDSDPGVHQVLMEKVFPRQAEIASIAGWIASLPESGSGAGDF